MLSYAAFSIRTIPTTEPLPRRIRRIIALGLHGRREHRAIEQLRCERGADIARKAGFDDRVAGAILDLHEHWDGDGDPRELRGVEIHPLARILAACQGLDVFLSTQGRARAPSVLTDRLGRWYDPDIADALLDACHAWPDRRPRCRRT